MPLLLHLLYLSVSQHSEIPQPFRSPLAIRSLLTQPCTLAQGCAAFQVGFPTSCLRRHAGAPMGWYPNVISLFAIFWIFCSKVKITPADAPRIWMNCHPILTNWHPNLCHPHHFTPDALPGTTLPIYPGLGQAPNMPACNPVACAANCKVNQLNTFNLRDKLYIHDLFHSWVSHSDYM